MAEYSATHHAYLHRRRQSALSSSIMDTSIGVPLGTDQRPERTLADKAQEYDRALRQSQTAAVSRKRTSGGGALAQSINPSASSIFGGPSMAQTAVLGDSQGSIGSAESSGVRTPKPSAETESSIPLGDLTPDGGVGSGLGESYVDGTKRSRHLEEAQENEDSIEDVGILGLLAQIYGRKDMVDRPK